jgi:hypothetical protein
MYTRVMQVLDSSQVMTVEYDPQNRSMVVTFNNGLMYEYKNVPDKIVGEFFSAESMGKYFSATIRPRFVGDRL